MRSVTRRRCNASAILAVAAPLPVVVVVVVVVARIRDVAAFGIMRSSSSRPPFRPPPFSSSPRARRGGPPPTRVIAAAPSSPSVASAAANDNGGGDDDHERRSPSVGDDDDDDDEDDEGSPFSKQERQQQQQQQQLSQQQQQQQQVIKSWLKTHLPNLPPHDLQSYTTRLYEEGFASLEELNSIDGGAAGDLHFMTKGHRRALLKNFRRIGNGEGEGEEEGGLVEKMANVVGERRAFELYERVVRSSERPSRRREHRESSSVSDRRLLPPPASPRSALDDDVHLDVTSRFPRERPSSLVNTIGGAASLSSSSGARNFPRGRPSLSIANRLAARGTYDEGQRRRRRMSAVIPPKASGGTGEEGARRRGPAASSRRTAAADDDASYYLDISRNFPPDRPSLLVNTGTLKRGSTTSGTYSEEERQFRDDGAKRNVARANFYLDLASQESERRGSGPSEEGEGGPRRRGPAASSRRTAAANDDDSYYLDISQNFPPDRPSLLVNTGTLKRGATTSGTYSEEERQFRDDGAKRNVAQKNFSPDLASLMGHPLSRNIDKGGGGRSKGGDGNNDGGYLDGHEFSSDLAPRSTEGGSAAISTNAAWKGISGMSGEEADTNYLDTPRAFAKDIDLAPPSVSKTDRSSSFEADGVVADEYLDTNPFSSNLRSSTPSSSPADNFQPRKDATVATTEQLQFLDTPRPFQSDVDMTSSNTSGKQFKRVVHREGVDADKFLDTNPFPSSVRYSTEEAKDLQSMKKKKKNTSMEQQQFLDTPRPFQSNVDMVSSNTSGARVKRATHVGEAADAYLDTPRPFQSDLGMASSNTSGARVKRATHVGEAADEYLDTPLPFQSNLGMASSNISGARVKRATHADEAADENLDTNPFSSNLRHSTMAIDDMRRKKTPTDQQHQFLDTPRVFQSGVDMVSSNMSGVRFKRSSDKPPEERNPRDYYDVTTTTPVPTIDGMARTKITGEGVTSLSDDEVRPGEDESFTDITRMPMSTLERTSSAVKDSNGASKYGSKRKPPAELLSRGAGLTATLFHNMETSDADSEGDPSEELNPHEEVMRWLLTHLPHLQEEDAIAYFNSFLEDGFDSLDNLGVLMEEDLCFMKKAHQRALLSSIHNEGEEIDVNENKTAVDAIQQEGEMSAWIAEQNQLVKERLALRLAEEEAAGSCEEEDTASTPNEVDAPKESFHFEDITRSKFVDRPSLSLAAPKSSITRESLLQRPSLAARFSSPPSSSESGNDSKPDQCGNEELRNPSINIAPRAELYQWYTKKALAQEIRLKDYFITIPNKDKSHQPKFTCIFTCPMTGEHFACGSWRVRGEAAEFNDNVYWYKNKKQAMTAAAARALDCFSLRTETTPTQRCEDPPYLSKADAPALPTLPTDVSLPSKL